MQKSQYLYNAGIFLYKIFIQHIFIHSLLNFTQLA